MSGPVDVRLSLGEFIASSYLSNANLRFGADGKGNSNSSMQSSESSLHSLNAAKLSLMLARAMSQLEEASNKDGNDVDPAYLQADNFFVSLHLRAEAPTNGHIGENGTVGTGGDDLDDDFDLGALMAFVFDGPNQGQSCDVVQDCPPGTDTNGSDVLGAKNPSDECETDWAVLSIDFKPPSQSNKSLSTPLSSVQILGNHIHAIFSGGNQHELSMICGSLQSTGEGGAEYHASKQQAFDETSLFATLLESMEYPVSVCRLLSDVMDSNTDSPITTFDDVISDLEQMVTHPQLFLYNPDDRCSSNVQFGQRCHGRVKELTTLLEIPTRLEQVESPLRLDRSEAVFVSGVAGSGKSHLVHSLGSFLENSGWMVLKAKFKRAEHNSREIVSTLFDEMIGNLVSTENRNEDANADYRRRAVKAISDELDPFALESLANFVPCIQELIADINTNASHHAGAEMTHWQLVFLLSKLLGAILSLDRRIMICWDDLQWCESTMLDLIKEIIVSVGKQEHGRQNVLFAGMYRDDEVTDSHPLSDQLDALQESTFVEVTEIKLPSLSKDDVADMIMSEIRLPRRLVQGLATVVHKRTSGHALFVVQLLNSLVRDSVIAYSPRKHRFDWDENRIAALKTLDSVASLIVSNLSTLGSDALQSLRILSCFGVQIPLSLLKLIAGCSFVPEGGIESFLPCLIDGGVVEKSGPSILFAHDLIQQHVYENIPQEERQRLQIDLGTSIASKIELDSSISTKASIEAAVEGITLADPGDGPESTLSYPLVAIATNQINFAGHQFISERPQQLRFAGWNLKAGSYAKERSNFQAALFYFESGIAFLGEGLWTDDSRQLCHDLHEGRALALFAMGNFPLAAQKATDIIDHVSFDDSLVAQYVLVRSLDSMGRYAEGVKMGLEVLRKLGFDIPLDPSPTDAVQAMRATAKTLSAYSFQQITNTSDITDSKKRKIYEYAEGIIVNCFRLGSASVPLPFVACAMINHSLLNGICGESAIAFLLLGYFMVSLEGNYEDGRYWGSVVLKILENSTGHTRSVSLNRADCMCTMFLNFMYFPFQVSAFRMMNLYQSQMAIGDIDSTLYALSFHITLSFFGGEKLSLLRTSVEELIRSMMKHSIKEGAKIAVLNELLIGGLIGVPEQPFPDFGGIIHDEPSLLLDAQAKKNNYLVESIHTRRFISAFWMADYTEAIKCSREVLKCPSSKLQKIQRVYHTFFMGLIAFQRYREGDGEEWFDEGKEVLAKMEVWAKKCSPHNFENKLQLLEAEHNAALCNVRVAKLTYERSAMIARGHGLVHEQGLAYELYGKYLESIIELPAAIECFKNAYICYTQWGATAKAEQLQKDHNLVFGENNELTTDLGTSKRKA